VELNVGIDAVNGPGMDTFSSGTATGNPAFQHILLDGLISTPQVLTVILPASAKSQRLNWKRWGYEPAVMCKSVIW
ncbi:hypothetical protein, partial [Pseudomonas aeruginosa]|uniref:hypothetical protein n=1 Tax=Pseudomonas aeruginosa TaxID=287 RepID=UPI0031B6CD92